MLRLYSFKVMNNFVFEYCFVSEVPGTLKNVQDGDTCDMHVSSFPPYHQTALPCIISIEFQGLKVQAMKNVTVTTGKAKCHSPTFPSHPSPSAWFGGHSIQDRKHQQCSKKHK